MGARCKKLKTLSLAGCLDVCPHDGLPALLSRIPQLARLDLAHCTQFHPVSHSTELSAVAIEVLHSIGDEKTEYAESSGLLLVLSDSGTCDVGSS